MSYVVKFELEVPGESAVEAAREYWEEVLQMHEGPMMPYSLTVTDEQGTECTVQVGSIEADDTPLMEQTVDPADIANWKLRWRTGEGRQHGPTVCLSAKGVGRAGPWR
jgi:hypothetical protein